MKTSIYLHQKKHLCAIVSSEEGYKFVDNIEIFCPDWQTLITEAKTGFPGSPFYDRYKNHDIDFWAQYLDIVEGADEDYEFLGSVDDGVILFSEEAIEDKGAFFAPLLTAIRSGTAHNFANIHDIVFTNDYILLSADSEVLACTNIKIPFEPNSKQKSLRELLRANLKSLRPLGNNVFCAKYGSSSSQRPDIENALFYNIGSTAFCAALTRETSVYFLRAQPTEISPCDDTAFPYLYHYSWAPKSTQPYWREHDLICKWEHIPLAKVNSATKAADYFLSIKMHPQSVTCLNIDPCATLGLKIQLFVPKKARFSNVVAVMKPMIDGIVCAVHAPSGIAADQISSRLNVSEDLFLSSEKTCLGSHPYIRVGSGRNSVVWNPQDDRLDFVVIEPVSVDDDGFSFSGQIFAIPCYM